MLKVSKYTILRCEASMRDHKKSKPWLLLVCSQRFFLKSPRKKTYNKKRCRHKPISHILWNEIHFSWSPTASDACKMKIAKKALLVLLMVTQLFNLWSMQNSISEGFGTATEKQACQNGSNVTPQPMSGF